MKKEHITTQTITNNADLRRFKTSVLLSTFAIGALLIPAVFAFADVSTSTPAGTGTTTSSGMGSTTTTGTQATTTNAVMTGMGSTTGTATSTGTTTNPGMGSTTNTGVGSTTATVGVGTSTNTEMGSSTTTGSGTTTATSTTGTGSLTDMWTTLITIQSLLTQLQTIQQQILLLLSGLHLGNMGGTIIPPTGTTTGATSNTVMTGMITPGTSSVKVGGGINFGGSQFGHEESVLVMLNGSTVTRAHADGGGNFSTGSMNAPLTPGMYTYTFKGVTSNILGSATVMVSQ